MSHILNSDTKIDTIEQCNVDEGKSMNRLLGILILGLAFFLGCGRGSDVTVELKNIVAPAASFSLTGDDRGAGDITSDVIIESLTIPILDVSLGTGDALSGSESEIVYECDGNTAAQCQVELVGTALENLLSGNNVHSVPQGTYTSVMVGTCREEGGYTAHLKAKAQFQGQTWYTKTGSGYMTLNAAEFGPVDIFYSNQCRNYSILSTPIAVGGDSLTVNLFIDLRNSAYVANATALPNGSWGTPLSGTPQGTDPFISLTYPNVSGSINSQPTLERYLVTDPVNTHAGKILGLYFEPNSNVPLGGYDRYYFTNSYYGQTNIVGGFKRAYLENGNLVVTDYRDGNTDTISGNGDKTIASFTRLQVGESVTNVPLVDRNGTATGAVATFSRID